MSDLITIQGNAEQLRSLTDIITLKIIDETDKPLDDTRYSVDAYADDAAKAAVEARGCTVTLIKTSAELEADLQRAYESISDELLDFGGNV